MKKIMNSLRIDKMVSDEMVLSYIKLKKNASTLEISRALGSSESTIRRSLTRLEDNGLVKRYHGGAHFCDESVFEDDVTYRKDVNWKAKNRIAEQASKVVEVNSTIILLGGTTVCAMCRYLQRKKLTVITNSLIVFDEFKYDRDSKIILLGGTYNPKERELGGVLTNNGMKNIRADYLFSGAMSIDEKLGVTTKDMDSVELYRLCIASSNQIYILADSSKFKGTGAAVTAYYDEITCLITDSGIDPRIKNKLSEQGLNTIIV